MPARTDGNLRARKINPLGVVLVPYLGTRECRKAYTDAPMRLALVLQLVRQICQHFSKPLCHDALARLDLRAPGLGIAVTRAGLPACA